MASATHMASAFYTPHLEPLAQTESHNLKPILTIAALILTVIIWLASLCYLITSERQRLKTAEDQKQLMDSRIEHITSALFEEAMKKCEVAWKEKADLEKRNEQLNVQLRDTKILLAGKGDGMQGWTAFIEATGWKNARDGKMHSRRVSTASMHSVGLDFRFKPQVVPSLPVQ
ncbi:rab guanine nucleotide exchange factor S2 [Coniosporium apollinis]|uniref:Rab guanine nucleotide exchange factor S2 n=2 Tax=Coniosporium TaxID=2810619 RepID=A0ABQ9NP24_9PEZI|nr:rab guanine nucleotide exchange factor S2 [Cladosporium sp. JES 115]KAJ9663281.1 rab guanine nucleotide exchange factor S2 [Coniosporium apollinis]